MKITGYIKLSEDDFDDLQDEDDENYQMPFYCQKCNHNDDWPDCVVECRKWRAEL